MAWRTSLSVRTRSVADQFKRCFYRTAIFIIARMAGALLNKDRASVSRQSDSSIHSLYLYGAWEQENG